MKYVLATLLLILSIAAAVFFCEPLFTHGWKEGYRRILEGGFAKFIEGFSAISLFLFSLKTMFGKNSRLTTQ